MSSFRNGHHNSLVFVAFRKIFGKKVSEGVIDEGEHDAQPHDDQRPVPREPGNLGII